MSSSKDNYEFTSGQIRPDADKSKSSQNASTSRQDNSHNIVLQQSFASQKENLSDSMGQTQHKLFVENYILCDTIALSPLKERSYYQEGNINYGSSQYNQKTTLSKQYHRNLSIESPQSERHAQMTAHKTSVPSQSNNNFSIKNNLIFSANSAKVTPRGRSRVVQIPNERIFSSAQRTYNNNLHDQSLMNDEDLMFKIDQVQEIIRQDQISANQEFNMKVMDLRTCLNQVSIDSQSIELQLINSKRHVKYLQIQIDQCKQEQLFMLSQLAEAKNLQSDQQLAIDAYREQIEAKDSMIEEFQEMFKEFEYQILIIEGKTKVAEDQNKRQDQNYQKQIQQLEMKLALQDEKHFQELKALQKENKELKVKQNQESKNQRLPLNFKPTTQISNLDASGVNDLRQLLKDKDFEIENLKRIIDSLQRSSRNGGPLNSSQIDLDSSRLVISSLNSIQATNQSIITNNIFNNSRDFTSNQQQNQELRGKLQQKELELSMVQQVNRTTLDELKRQNQELKDSLLRKNISLNEKELQIKNFKFNVTIGLIVCFFGMLWGSNPRPFGLAPKASALDHSAKLPFLRTYLIPFLINESHFSIFTSCGQFNESAQEFD
ncbi:UNKNOWN [Stylonychia lemnae]|uniref:Uncharacterized protein n=1 Tax=Stylonychia lemnae TaxID=5949 RepID=A0A078AS02_STYLE|nr:UNKNOWN [Stylonychia lemnae]|eukprot:CDW83977.1 UNKNOWN [Stylonychia lemnae]